MTMQDRERATGAGRDQLLGLLPKATILRYVTAGNFAAEAGSDDPESLARVGCAE